MQFAIVESSPGFLEPVVLIGSSGGRVSCRRLTGEIASAPLDRVVHAGVVGDGARPTVVYQWAPTWVMAKMQAAGYGAERIAANPKPMQGVVYQSGENKWTPKARELRWKEQEIYRQHVQPDGSWSALSYTRVFGYHRVRQFIESYRRREVKPESFFWCMVFAALTASEATKTAEANLAGFAKLLAGRLASGARHSKDLISFDEFRRKGAGFQEQRYKTLQGILEHFPAIERFLATTALSDRALRRAMILTPDFDTPGLGCTKLSFSLECYGQDVACLDRWMLRAIGVAQAAETRGGGVEGNLERVNQNIEAHRRFFEQEMKKKGKEPPEERFFEPVGGLPWAPFSDGAYVFSDYGADRFSGKIGPVLDEYEFYEEALKRTAYYRYAVEEGAPNPLCRAQWTMWEDVLLHHPRPNVRLPMATHSPLFFVIEGEGKARKLMKDAERERAAKTREERARDRA